MVYDESEEEEHTTYTRLAEVVETAGNYIIPKEQMNRKERRAEKAKNRKKDKKDGTKC
jgi:hypothetical protein